VRDQKENQMARVAAAKTLLQVNDEQSQRLGGAAQALPGFVIVINAPTAHAPRTWATLWARSMERRISQ
jgi:hypothetical protein